MTLPVFPLVLPLYYPLPCQPVSHRHCPPLLRLACRLVPLARRHRRRHHRQVNHLLHHQARHLSFHLAPQLHPPQYHPVGPPAPVLSPALALPVNPQVSPRLSRPLRLVSRRGCQLRPVENPVACRQLIPAENRLQCPRVQQGSRVACQRHLQDSRALSLLASRPCSPRRPPRARAVSLLEPPPLLLVSQVASRLVIQRVFRPDSPPASRPLNPLARRVGSLPASRPSLRHTHRRQCSSINKT